jgi:hypothetical protein
MLFQKAYSPLVRLSDTIKSCLLQCELLTSNFFVLYDPYKGVFGDIKSISSMALDGKLDQDFAESQIAKLTNAVPRKTLHTLPILHQQAHAFSLSVILNSCFTLEAYINALSYYLLYEPNSEGKMLLPRTGDLDNIDYDEFERKSPYYKWYRVSKLTGGDGFDKGVSPWSDFEILFKFRNDHVHAKVRNYSADYHLVQYSGKLPDPLSGSLDIGHAIYAAEVYWNMIQEIHKLLSISSVEFHRHYNLMPWIDGHYTNLKELADKFVTQVRS